MRDAGAIDVEPTRCARRRDPLEGVRQQEPALRAAPLLEHCAQWVRESANRQASTYYFGQMHLVFGS